MSNYLLLTHIFSVLIPGAFTYFSSSVLRNTHGLSSRYHSIAPWWPAHATYISKTSGVPCCNLVALSPTASHRISSPWPYPTSLPESFSPMSITFFTFINVLSWSFTVSILHWSPWLILASQTSNTWITGLHYHLQLPAQVINSVVSGTRLPCIAEQ